MKQMIFLILFLSTCAALAQDWQKSGLDSFYIDNSERMVLVSPADKFGMAFKSGNLPDYNERFWLKADWWNLETPKETDAYLAFGNGSGDSLQLWAAGYSLKQKKITFGKIRLHPDGGFQYDVLFQKPVEIVDHRRIYVFMFIFYRETNHVKIEVNGVPMLIEAPPLTVADGFDYFGYMVRSGKVRFQDMIVEGR